MSFYNRFRERAEALLKDVRNKGLIKWVLTLNLFDILTTLFVIEWFGGSELNPLMAVLLATHPILFVFVKILILQTVVGLAIWMEAKGGKVPAIRFDGWKPIFYSKKEHYVPRWFWLLIIVIFSLTLFFNVSMICAGFLLT